MKEIFIEIKQYFKEVPKGVLTLSLLLLAFMTWANYSWGWNDWLRNQSGWIPYAGWYAIFLAAFATPYLLSIKSLKTNHESRITSFLWLLFAAPALFSWKMVMRIDLPFSSSPYQNAIYNAIAYWPIKLTVLMALIGFLWWNTGRPAHLYGLSRAPQGWTPYLTMLALMVPLIALAATQPDFTAAYPRWQSIAYPSLGLPTPGQTILFELSYGTDFLGIELFFRGFLVLAFARYAGTGAILPMAMFYCTIHFGKPLGECISSFFGGTLLGLVTYHTTSIWGGLLVHVGIAWMMEAAGYLAG